MQWPIVPYRGLRGVDDFGDGAYGAPRSTDGRPRYHRGLDIRANPKDDCVAPFAGRIVTVGRAYADPACDLRSIHILGTGSFDGFKLLILYAKPITLVQHNGFDGWVKQGERIAVVQDVAAHHERRAGGERKMNGHIHVELRRTEGKRWVIVDPTPYFVPPS